jgi:predicted dehydrogenase
MGKQYRAGIVGMGNMGRAHAENLLRAPDVELAALCSDPLDDARAYAEAKGLSCPLYRDGAEMAGREALDLVYICLPPFAHTGQLEAAAAAGAHIFIEKPIALTVDRGRSMVAAVEKAGVYAQVGYHMRQGGAVRRLKEEIASGKAGRPTLFTARYESNSLHTPWWIDAAQCGGQVFEQVIHLYDLALYLCGPPRRVSGFTANLQHQHTPGYTVEDTSVSALCFAGGALGGITGSNCAAPGVWSATFRVLCQNLVADFTDPCHGVFTYLDGPEKRVETLAFNQDLVLQEDLYFLDVLRGSQPPFATLAEGLLGLRTVSAVVESSRLGGVPIQIEEA